MNWLGESEANSMKHAAALQIFSQVYHDLIRIGKNNICTSFTNSEKQMLSFHIQTEGNQLEQKHKKLTAM